LRTKGQLEGGTVTWPKVFYKQNLSMVHILFSIACEHWPDTHEIITRSAEVWNR